MGELFRGEARRRQNSPLAPEPKNHHTKPDKQPCAGRKQGGNYLVPRAVANERKQRKKKWAVRATVASSDAIPVLEIKATKSHATNRDSPISRHETQCRLPDM